MVNERKMWCCRKNKGMARHKINKRKKEEMRYRLDEFLKSCSQVWTGAGGSGISVTRAKSRLPSLVCGVGDDDKRGWTWSWSHFVGEQ